ncbi:MAG: FtsX-like permease family protein [Sarcina sp.]
MNKFLFFNFKKSKMFYTFLVLVIAIWGVIFSQFISMKNFERDFSEIYMENLPVEDGLFFRVNVLQDVTKKEKYIKDMKLLLDEKINNETYSILIAEEFGTINRSALDLKSKNKKKRFVSGDDENLISLVAMNYEYINYLKPTIKLEDLKNNDGIKSAVLGSDYQEDYKIGDIMKIEDEEIRAVGFFDEDSYYVDGPSPAVWIRPTNSIISIFEEELTSLNYFILRSENEDLNNLQKDINTIGVGNIATTFEYDLEDFMQAEGVVRQREETLIKMIFMSILNILIIISVILYTINDNRQTIGVIYSVGGNSKLIFKIIIKELSILISIGIIISIILSYPLSGMAILFFVNQNRLMTIAIGQILLIVVIIITTLIALLNLRKLSNSELIGGFRE